MPKLIEVHSTKSETIALPYGSERVMSSLVIQIRGNGGWAGSLVLQGKVRGSTLPFTDHPYQDLITNGDVAAGTAILADTRIAVRADLQEFQLVHTLSAGSVDLAVRDGQG